MKFTLKTQKTVENCKMIIDEKMNNIRKSINTININQ